MQLALQSAKIWVAHTPVDFRRSINGLSAIVADRFPNGVSEDSIFVFYNRSRDKLKILGWHRNGYVLLYKRLEQGRFTVQPSRSGDVSIDAKQLGWLLAGLDWVQLSDWHEELCFENYH